ncbi:probable adenylate cyclase [Crocosphaera subtropica ATCC 51142]|uniref:histidine kinase n=1 Tax=Crocosphaera subtropica (strain ATCC 51142 / BH68) TaxID=43989 RepID=B1X2B3_CROS5|nr:CHASE2 domain-containing protein [Crocosphaera subtropica]ACB54274.1 probable adenylate cyclase [Crocosphaera subtropica ATCC 51142]
MKISRTSKLRGNKGFFVALLCAVLISLICRYAGFWQENELYFFDQMTQKTAPSLTQNRVVIVKITEEDVKTFPAFTPDDRTLARTLKNIAQQKPRAIGLDMVRDIPVPPGSNELKAVFENTSNLYGIGKFTGIEGDPFFTYIAPPYTLDNLQRVGDVSVVVDDDGVVRRANLFPTTGESAIPSLGLLLAEKYLENEGISPEGGTNNRLKLGKVEFPIFNQNTGGYIRADDGGYQTLMRWIRPLQQFKQISLTEVYENRIPVNFFQDKIVLIGYWTTSQKRDLFYTPFSEQGDGKTPRQAFGVEIQANFSEYILHTVLDGLPPLKSLPEGLEIIWLTGWGLIGSLIIWRFRYLSLFFSPLNLIVIVGLFGLLIIVALLQIQLLSFQWGWWLPVAATNSSVVIFLLITILYIFRERILEHIENLEQKVEERTISLTQALETNKRNQQQLIKQEKLAFLGRLTAGFCHQFKNPLYQLKYGLATIINMLDESEYSVLDSYKNDERLLDLLVGLQEPIEKLEMIFKLILLSPSQQRITYIEVSPNQFVKAILNSVLKYHSSPLLASQIKTYFSPQLEQVNKIPQKLEIPLFNIIENAFDVLAEAQNKKFNFVPNLILETEVNSNYWSISIKDNGLGIDPSIENYLFEPFVTNKPETQGIGLGLYISREVMNDIGGKICFNSLNKGVSFTLYIPYVKQVNN